MAKFRTAGKKSQASILRLVLLLLLFAVYGLAQPDRPEEKKNTPGESPATTQPTPQPTTQASTPAVAEERKISPQEAEKLFRSVDETLRFASKDTLFPIKHEVKRQLV